MTVRAAIESSDPLPGTSGFAGIVDDRLVRDVLGRVPLYVEDSSADPDGQSTVSRSALDEWAFSPAALEEPVLVPAGSIVPPISGEQSDQFEQLWTLPSREPEADTHIALDRVDRAIRTAVDAVRADNTAIAFSGGVDSVLLAERFDAPLYVTGFPGSNDVKGALTAADMLGREVTVVELTHADLERAIPTVVNAIDRTNAMDLQIALALYYVSERVEADGFDKLVVGQGADELFGGYQKVRQLDHRVDANSVRGAVRETIRTLPEQLPRDVLAIQAAGVEPVAPYLHDRVVDAALSLPTKLLATDEVSKRGLRAVANRYVPEPLANREKKAIQYGSLVSRELDRLARQAGYKRRIGDHISKYVESMLESENELE